MVFLGTPTLETERLILRKIEPGDCEAIFEYGSDPEVTRYVTWETHRTVRDAEAFVGYTLERYLRDEAGDWGIVLKQSNKLIGTTGFVWVDHHQCGHIGYVLARPYWNQGITTEAVQRLIRFGFTEMGLNRIEAVHFLPNEASGKVMRKAGMKYEGILRQKFLAKGKFQDVKMYAILREDLSNLRSETDENLPG